MPARRILAKVYLPEMRGFMRQKLPQALPEGGIAIDVLAFGPFNRGQNLAYWAFPAMIIPAVALSDHRM
jgi:hypothetical protein